MINHLKLMMSIISVLLLFLTASIDAAGTRWSEPVLLSTNSTDWPGVTPVVSYAPNGDLRVFYTAGEKPNDYLASRLCERAETDFDDEVTVDIEGRSAGVMYCPGYTVIVAVAKAPSLTIRRSSNYGHRYSTRSGYPGARNWPSSPNYMPSYFTADGDDIRIAFTYREYNAVLGSSVEVCTAQRVDGTWNAETNLSDTFGVAQTIGMHENGDQVCIIASSGVFYSGDNGASYSMIEDGTYIPEMLTAGDMAVDTNGRVYILREYSYGPGDTNKFLSFTYSDDCGASWHSPQKLIIDGGSDYTFYPCFTIDGDRMIVVWQHSEVANEHAFIRCMISEDKGETWGPIETAVSLGDGELLALNGFPAIDISSSNGRVTLAYVVQKAGEYFYYSRELITDSDNDGIPDWAEEDAGTDPGEQDSDGDGQSDGSEAVAGTDSMDSNSVFTVYNCDIYDDDISLNWQSIVGSVYHVQSTGNLKDEAWTNVPGHTNINGTGKELSFDSPASDSHRFFRIRVEKKPAPEGMVLIPAGPFEMGDHYAEGSANALPVHTNTIDAFYIDRFEVSGDLWTNVYNWATNNGYTFDNPGSYDGPEFPICAVSWYDCVKWCNARSEKEGLTLAYYTDGVHAAPYREGQVNITNGCVNWDANGYRLPTEAEWEKAARGGLTGHHYPWESFGGSYSNHIDDSYANFGYSNDPYEDETDADTTPVGYYNWNQWPTGPDRANGYGLYDTAGNVLEWCWDRYQSDWYSVQEESINPLGPDTGSSRTRRGGHWDNYNTVYLRCSARSSFLPSFALDKECGFRTARSN